MLALLGVATIVVLLAAILSRRMSALVALIIVPIAASLIGGFGLHTSQFVLGGIKALAPVVGMFVFAILYFGTITDAGTLDPIIDRILRTVGTRPTRIVMGAALLALLIHLDGSGAVCFLIAIPAMLPLYDRLKMDRRVGFLAPTRFGVIQSAHSRANRRARVGIRDVVDARQARGAPAWIGAAARGCGRARACTA